MKIGVVGVGYVGLTAGTCLAESGNEVVGVDIACTYAPMDRYELPANTNQCPIPDGYDSFFYSCLFNGVNCNTVME
jgi:UDP-glucose 6-dehydrogenase